MKIYIDIDLLKEGNLLIFNVDIVEIRDERLISKNIELLSEVFNSFKIFNIYGSINNFRI